MKLISAPSTWFHVLVEVCYAQWAHTSPTSGIETPHDLWIALAEVLGILKMRGGNVKPGISLAIMISPPDLILTCDFWSEPWIPGSQDVAQIRKGSNSIFLSSCILFLSLGIFLLPNFALVSLDWLGTSTISFFLFPCNASLLWIIGKDLLQIYYHHLLQKIRRKKLLRCDWRIF